MIYRPGVNNTDDLKPSRKQKNGVRMEPRSQMVMEYVFMLGVLIAVFVTMAPLIRRGIQAMVRMVADQVGNQVNAEQEFGSSGHLVNSYTITQLNQDLNVSEYLGTTTYTYNRDDVLSVTNSLRNLGFMEED
jgi:hypothetical protein